MIDTACARTLAGTRWFEKFQVELKKYATTVEVVPDSETFRFGPGEVKNQTDRAQCTTDVSSRHFQASSSQNHL